MRLIDKDALHQTFMKWFKKEMLNDDKISKTISWADALLKSEPTIEAIPIDWIQSWWGNQGVPSLSHCLENTDEVIRTMLRDWKDENETTD